MGRGRAATWGHLCTAFWTFSWWVVTKRSSRSLMVWLRIFLKNSDGFVNQTGHLGHPHVLSHQLSQELQPLGKSVPFYPWVVVGTMTSKGKATTIARRFLPRFPF